MAIVPQDILRAALSLISSEGTMVSFMNHEVFESVDLSVSQGNGPQDSECSGMDLGQSMTTSRRLLQPTMPSGEPSIVNEKQYKSILHPRRRRAGAKARGENGPLKAKKPRARDYYGRFLAKNGTGEGSVPRGGPPRDGRGRFVAMKGGRRGVGGGTCVNQYESIVNLQAPDFTTLLRIMDGGRHGIKGSKHYRNIARLQDPGFASVLNAMNNISYKAVDDGPYDVLKVLLQADGGMAGW